ncbi:hypothetical protein VHEMI01151 [[Torrubiella] hemipterigena]|uniref:LPXTG-domain-containing protein n=1 Tax=[Torrubiella] hemipterigena TaxID=1531966 RepID=A0A0A1SSB4_9HYPO|nr:hypothetical protein VHEMI01151 [[Torrubiella] hemipterigena]
MLRLKTGVALALAALPVASAVYSTPNSQCASQCGNVLDATPYDDIACLDSEFNGNTGQIFESCVKCQMNSTFANGNQTDAKASLYNLRYTLSTCLWSVPTVDHRLGSNPCTTSKACGVFQAAMTYNNASVKTHGYEYCDLWPTTDGPDFAGCVDCLQVVPETRYLSNFVTMLQAGCEQRPAPGVQVAVSGDIFSETRANVSTPHPRITIDPSWYDQGPLSLPGKVGIGIGGFVFLLVVAGFLIVCIGKRRRRAYLRQLEAKYAARGWPSPGGQGDAFGTPISQRPLNGWQDSPMAETPNRQFPRYFSPYSSQLNSPATPGQHFDMAWPESALPKGHSFSPISPQEQAVGLWQTPASPEDKGKSVAESYEMNYVEPASREAPVLGHPGFGRNSTTPPLTSNGTPQGHHMEVHAI